MIIVVVCIVILCTRRSLKKEAFHVYDEISTKLNANVTNPSYGVTVSIEDGAVAFNTTVTDSDIRAHQLSQKYDYDYIHDESDELHHNTTTATSGDVEDNLQYHTTVDQSHEAKAVVHSPYLPPTAKQTGESEYGVINQPQCDNDPNFDIAVDKSHTAEFCLPLITNNAGEGKYGVINQPQCDNDPNFNTTVNEGKYGVINQPQCGNDPNFDTAIDQSHTAEFCLPVIANNAGEVKYGVINQPQCDNDPNFDTTGNQNHATESCLLLIANNARLIDEGKCSVINQPKCDDPICDTTLDQNHTTKSYLSFISNNAKLTGGVKYGIINQSQCDDPNYFDPTNDQRRTSPLPYLPLIADNARSAGEGDYGVINQPQCDDAI